MNAFEFRDSIKRQVGTIIIRINLLHAVVKDLSSILGLTKPYYEQINKICRDLKAMILMEEAQKEALISSQEKARAQLLIRNLDGLSTFTLNQLAGGIQKQVDDEEYTKNREGVRESYRKMLISILVARTRDILKASKELGVEISDLGRQLDQLEASSQPKAAAQRKPAHA